MNRFIPPKRTRELLKYAAPCMAEQFMLVLVGIVSTAIIGHLGKAELTASSMSTTLVNWLQCIYTGLATGATVLIGRFWGNNEKENVRRTFFQAILLTTSISLIVLSLLLVFQNQLIELFFGTADEEVNKNLHIYFGLCMIGMPATAATSAITASLRGIGDNKSAFFSTAALNVLNIILSYSLIYGIGVLGIKPMGIRGAAIAIFTARYLTLLITFTYIIVLKKPILPSLKHLSLDSGIVKRLVTVSIPSAVEAFVFQGGFFMLQTILLGFGTVLQAGYQIGNQVNGINNAPSIALGVAMTSTISQQLGKRDYKAALEYVDAAKYVVKIGFTAMFIIMLALSPWQAYLYTSDPAVIKSATFFIALFAFCVIPVGYMQTLAGVLRGAGDVKYVTVSAVLGLWLFRICTVIVVSRLTNSGYIGVASGVPADFFVRAIMYHFRIKKGNWLRIRV